MAIVTTDWLERQDVDRQDDEEQMRMIVFMASSTMLFLLFALQSLEATSAQTVALDKTPAEINAYEGDYMDGCLTTLLPATFPKDRFQRVCNSDDLENDDHCRHNTIGYNETRLSNMNW